MTGLVNIGLAGFIIFILLGLLLKSPLGFCLAIALFIVPFGGGFLWAMWEQKKKREEWNKSHLGPRPW